MIAVQGAKMISWIDPWLMGFVSGMVFGGILMLIPLIITISNMYCTFFGFQLG